MTVRSLDSSAAKFRSLTPSAEGETVRLAFTVSDEDMAAFAALSGDRNPLHCDDAFARSKGFPGRVVYGALLVAKISQVIGMELPGRDAVWSGINIQFVAPLSIGQPAEIEATVTRVSTAVRALELTLRIQAGGKVIARGKASATVHRDA
jgi:3-hydroxybutyryl-CoA dehydratase